VWAAVCLAPARIASPDPNNPGKGRPSPVQARLNTREHPYSHAHGTGPDTRCRWTRGGCLSYRSVAGVANPSVRGGDALQQTLVHRFSPRRLRRSADAPRRQRRIHRHSALSHSRGDPEVRTCRHISSVPCPGCHRRGWDRLPPARRDPLGVAPTWGVRTFPGRVSGVVDVARQRLPCSLLGRLRHGLRTGRRYLQQTMVMPVQE
jgi:hypothetical protein